MSAGLTTGLPNKSACESLHRLDNLQLLDDSRPVHFYPKPNSNPNSRIPEKPKP
ncbi:hypothetical protein Hdeb2414_s0354g00874801 [Helianthus debilis subsp. tardiflorus]